MGQIAASDNDELVVSWLEQTNERKKKGTIGMSTYGKKEKLKRQKSLKDNTYII